MKERNCAILGSGFGLYGYLPTFAQEGYHILLPKRYTETFASRPELLQFSDRVEFVRDEQEAIQKATTCVIAKRPQDQPYWVDVLLQSRSCKKVILEKPIAITPSLALMVLHACRNGQLNVRVGYTFLHTEWGRKVLKSLADEQVQSISIQWKFMAHHFSHHLQNWKRFDRQGGGALRFYGIQMIPLLTAAEGWNWMRSEKYHENEGETLRWIFDGETKRKCRVHIDVDSASPHTVFCCQIDGTGSFPEFSYCGKSPFPLAVAGQDSRVAMLAEIVDGLEHSDDFFPFYEKTICLWDAIEQGCRSIAIDNKQMKSEMMKEK